jgi:hypothetical protein
MARYKSKTTFEEIGKTDNSFVRKCNAIIFKNVGDQRCKINGVWTLEPGEETPTISTGHPEVVDETEYKVVFDPASGGTAPLVVCIYTTVYPITSKGAANTDACEKF